MIVDELRRRARREGYEKLCAFTHAPGYFIHMGFSIVPHLWLHREDLHRLREVPAVPPAAASTRWSCRSTSRSTPSDGYGLPAAAPRVTALVDAAALIEPIAGGVTTPRGFRAAGVSAGIKAKREPRPGAARLGRAGARRRRSSPPTARRPRRCSCRASTSRAPAALARAIVVNSGCANACTGDEGLRGRARHGRRNGARSSAARPSRCWSRRPASSASRCRSTRSAPACRRRSARSAPTRDRGGARDHDDRSVSEGSGGASRRSAAATSPIGGMAKGSGMIEPMMATMLGVRHDRCGGAAAAARPRAARGGRRHLQRHHRRRRVLDQRLRDAARQRRQRRRRSTRRATARSSQALTAVCRELALGIVRGGEGATKLVTVTRHRRARQRRGAARRPRRSPTRRSSRPRSTAAIRTGAG